MVKARRAEGGKRIREGGKHVRLLQFSTLENIQLSQKRSCASRGVCGAFDGILTKITRTRDPPVPRFPIPRVPESADSELESDL